MQFRSARPDIVRAINQRWLLKYWSEARREKILPAWQELEGRQFTAMSANLSFTDVVSGNGRPRFLIRYHGSRIGEAYGSDCHGKYLDEILPPAYRDAALATYWQVVDGRVPVYTAVDVNDAEGRLVHYERLLLPFSRDGATVDRILASLEMVSLSGGFRIRNLMSSGAQGSSFGVQVTIDATAGL